MCKDDRNVYVVYITCTHNEIIQNSVHVRAICRNEY